MAVCNNITYRGYIIHLGRNTIVNTFLTQMDGIDNDKDQRVLVIGATNLLNKIDSAISRSNRLGRHIEVNIPKCPDQRFAVLMAASKNGTKPMIGSNLSDGGYLTAAEIFREVSRDEYTEGWK